MLEQKNRLECSCIGARNKIVLKSALVFEKNRLEQFGERLEQEKKSISESEPATEFDKKTKISRMGNIDKMIHSVHDDTTHVGNLFEKVSNIEICGE